MVDPTPDPPADPKAASPSRPVAPATGVAPLAGGHGALQELLERMSENSDFPAMSHAVTRILGMASSDTESIGTVTGEILKDVALSNKLLRMVNTAYYARGGSISTVSRAVSLVGFDAIRNMALSLVLIERMGDKAHAEMMTEEFLRSLMAASIARALSPRGDEEETFIGALFQDLGRLLTSYYFPQEAATIRDLVRSDAAAVSEERASIRVLGQSFESLALAVAREWEMPQEISRYMRKPPGEPPARAADPQERLRWVTLAANQVADALARSESDEHVSVLEPICKRFCRPIGTTTEQMLEAIALARERLIELVHGMDLHITPGTAAHRLLYAGSSAGGNGHPPAADGAAGGAGRGPARSQAASETMAAGIAEITQVMADPYQVSDVVRMVLETMYRAKGFDRVIFCMRDPRTDALTGRYGLGKGVDPMVRAFEVPLGSGASDLFQMICAKGADTLIADATVPRVAQRLPAWYNRLVNAPTFLVLPLLIREKVSGLIYADMTDKNALVLTENELALLRTLRNQIVAAFEQPH